MIIWLIFWSWLAFGVVTCFYGVQKSPKFRAAPTLVQFLTVVVWVAIAPIACLIVAASENR